MIKKINLLTVIFVFAAVLTAMAGPPPFKTWRCLVYDGTVVNDPEFMVWEDTGVFVTNPNSVPVHAWIRVLNKNGREVFQGWLLDHFEEIGLIPPMGYAWVPLSYALAKENYVTAGREKFTYQITMPKPDVSNSEPKLK